MPLETAEQRGNEEEVVEKTTTQMYRAPEMVDLYLERELTEKVDVWVSLVEVKVEVELSRFELNFSAVDALSLDRLDLTDCCSLD